MALQRSTILNMLRDRIGMPRVDYTDSDWETSSAATDPVHSETILLGDLWQAMKEVAADSRGKWARRQLRIVENQYEYPLPSDCMCVWSVLHKFSGSWQPIDYLPHEEFFTGFSENVLGYPPSYFSLQSQTSSPVHYTGTITSGNGDSPPVLIDTSANLGITLTGTEIYPGDRVFNTDDDSYGYVDYLYAGAWDREATADAGSSATQLYDADAGFVALGVAVGDIVTRTPQPADSENGAWGVVSQVAEDTLTFSVLYNHESGFSANDSYTVGQADRIYLTASGLVADTEEGLVGGAAGTFGVETATMTSEATTFGASSVTITGVDLGDVEAGMAVESTNSSDEFTGGEVASVASQTVTLESAWSNGTPDDDTSVSIGTGDAYQIESAYSTLDTLFLSDVPSTSDTLGTESLTLIYIPCPQQPTRYYHPVELSEAYTPALIAKMLEYAKAREKGELPNYERLLDRGLAQRRLVNRGVRGNSRRTQRQAARLSYWEDSNWIDQRSL